MQYNAITIELFTAANLSRLIMYFEYNTKFETMVRIQDKNVAWL